MAYRTSRIIMRPGSRKYAPFFGIVRENMRHAKAVYNTTLFYMRNLFTGLKKTEDIRTENERMVIQDISRCLSEMNEKRVTKGRAPYPIPSPESPYLPRYAWTGVMNRVLKESCPRPACFYSKLEQQVVMAVCRNMKSFQQALGDYRLHSGKYHAAPQIPGYLKNDTFTLDYDCQMVKTGGEGRHHWIRLAGILADLPTGKAAYEEIVSLRLSWRNGRITASVCRKYEEEPKKLTAPGKVIGIDPGIDNFLAVCPGFGKAPFLIRGGALKSVNQYFNKKRAEIQSRIKQEYGIFTCHELDRISAKREDFLYNYFHQTAVKIVDYALLEGAGTIVVGKNDGWKQRVNMGKKGNQQFVQIPYTRFFRILKDRAEREGIRVVFQEESYTSRASALDRDILPAYHKEDKKVISFSGQRVRRGMYVSSNGTRINADVNGAANILRKYSENALQDDLSYLTRSVLVKNVI
ncbi:MAG: transposase [Eubacterium sp.]|nr:transposase [Eubacterium sp.]